MRPSKSFNGLNTLTYNSYVYDLNHGFDENHKQVTVLKETTTDDILTTTGNLIKSYSGLLPTKRSILAGAIFNGNSFGLLSNFQLKSLIFFKSSAISFLIKADRLSINGSFNVSFSFRTTARNGILMIIVDPRTNDSFFVELYDSQVLNWLNIDWTSLTNG